MFSEETDYEEGVEQASPLDAFIDNGWITGVLHRVKSGKEATVYCCEADPSRSDDLFAAKVYHERERRNFKNDSLYREGRIILDRRLRKAFEKKTRAGRAFQAGSWQHFEYDALELLHGAGADVPRPVANASGAFLMEYVGDREGPAPPLNAVVLEPNEARRLFGQVMRNVELWLSLDRIHADLSPYNILYWNGGLKVIDFPQTVDPRFNPNAQDLLFRDLDNVCRYFTRFGVQADPRRITDHLWGRFKRSEL